jgi:hypothetical protein
VDARRGDDVVPTAVRVWTVRATDGGSSDAPAGEDRPGRRRPVRRHPPEALIFDTETRDRPPRGC